MKHNQWKVNLFRQLSDDVNVASADRERYHRMAELLEEANRLWLQPGCQAKAMRLEEEVEQLRLSQG